MSRIFSLSVFRYVLLFAMVIDLVLPFLISRYYIGYNHKTMVMSILGSSNNKVAWLYNTWLILFGLIFCYASFLIYNHLKVQYPTLSLIIFVSLLGYGIGGCIVSGIFSVEEKNKFETLASSIHGYSAAIGFMLLLLVSIITVMLFKGNLLMLSVIIALFSLLTFCLFIASDKPNFNYAYEGLWQRLTLFGMYVSVILILFFT